MATKKKHLKDAVELYQTYLKKQNMFFTKERQTLLAFIFEQADHFSADELLFELQRTKKKISRATLYRSLNQMVEAGILTESDFGHGHTHYEVSLGDRPHAHLIDAESDQVKEVYSQDLEMAIEKLIKKEKFMIKRFKIQLFGSFQKKTR